MTSMSHLSTRLVRGDAPARVTRLNDSQVRASGRTERQQWVPRNTPAKLIFGLVAPVLARLYGVDARSHCTPVFFIRTVAAVAAGSTDLKIPPRRRQAADVIGSRCKRTSGPDLFVSCARHSVASPPFNLDTGDRLTSAPRSLAALVCAGVGSRENANDVCPARHT